MPTTQNVEVDEKYETRNTGPKTQGTEHGARCSGAPCTPARDSPGVSRGGSRPVRPQARQISPSCIAILELSGPRDAAIGRPVNRERPDGLDSDVSGRFPPAVDLARAETVSRTDEPMWDRPAHERGHQLVGLGCGRVGKDFDRGCPDYGSGRGQGKWSATAE